MNQVSLFKKYIKNMVLFENLYPARLTVDGFKWAKKNIDQERSAD